MAQKKARPRNLKNQRWAAIVAAILALGMVVSLVGAYIGQAVGGAPFDQQQAEPEPEDYLAHYESEVERLEAHLEEEEATEELLLELAENYRYLTIVHQVFFDDQDAMTKYEAKLADVFSSLVELEPQNPTYRLELINLYVEQRESEDLIIEEIAVARDIMRDDPDPQAHLALVQILATLGDEELLEEETGWLHDYFSERVDAGLADSEERFFFAVLLGEFRGDIAAAENLLEEILDQESEESPVYQNAQSYLEYYRAGSDEQEIIFE